MLERRISYGSTQVMKTLRAWEALQVAPVVGQRTVGSSSP